uniref:Coiled-coil domain-containing protein 25 n=1 Tax=Globodera rostochiensis TaxID=31243 RepID=A0A914I0H8_GLORO
MYSVVGVVLKIKWLLQYDLLVALCESLEFISARQLQQVMVECSGITPRIWARYENGVETSLSVENEPRQKILEVVKKWSFISQENEKLIRWGWPEDVWFHVDKLSSAHVYMRLLPNQTIDDIPEDKLLEDCCQLVKANSIEGCKLASTDVVYTMWSNLKKTGDMVTGQVGFHSDKAVKKVRVERLKDVVNRLNKTKIVKKDVDFQELREQRDAEERRKLKEQQRMERKQVEAESERREREKEARSYEHVFKAEKGTTNKDGANLEEDFM